MRVANIILVVSCLASIAHGAPRILGGQDAPNHKYPYIVSLQTNFLRHFCSGSILNEEWILTAAHCVEKNKPGSYYIAAGTNYLDEQGTVYKPQISIIHEKYVNFLEYDIALIRVIGKITFDKFVQPMELPKTDLDPRNYTGIFAGWGSTYVGGPSPNNLQEIVFNVISNNECKESQEITARHICTYNKVSQGICFGDSGGPLVVNDVQVGIASYVNPCGVGDPDIYTRVFSYRDWILRTMEKFAHVFS